MFQPGATFGQHLREVVQGVECSIGHGGVSERPEPLGGLQLWGRGWQGDGLDPWGLSLRGRDMETGAVLDHEHVMAGAPEGDLPVVWGGQKRSGQLLSI
ncbi:hypothetical protein GCM10010840_35610 [Deinococcus aerolatus]|uniref:Uncharacterized protein n=1 Tax=Deinococcus aerolatus TaxID=522487 RepID=A0ABQ2GGB3_9DEIO|nr:hypothetical protein GCM10010840_35610 [Deinococcus aerolatus]